MPLYDYFRAADHDAARTTGSLPGGPLGRDGQAAGTDGLALKNLDPTVVMGQLLALILGVEWSPGIIDSEYLLPLGPPPGPDADYSEETPWMTGPWLEDLGAAVRDGFADVDDAQLARVCEEWQGIEELGGLGAEEWAADVAREFVALARRARDAGEQVYCWSSL